jgi:microcompartment protein CcmK/EutM
MNLGRVTGTVVATQKDPKLEGLKFLLLDVLNLKLQPTGGHAVAVDAVGAGMGEVVMYASGSSARQTIQTEGLPVDAVIMAIIDEIAVGKDRIYQK